MKKELTDQAAMLDYVNELLTNPKREIVGINTVQYDGDEDITKVVVTIAPSDSDV